MRFETSLFHAASDKRLAHKIAYLYAAISVTHRKDGKWDCVCKTTLTDHGGSRPQRGDLGAVLEYVI